MSTLHTLLHLQVLPQLRLALECVRFALAGLCAAIKEPAAPSLLWHMEPNRGGCSWTERLENKRLITDSRGGGAPTEQRDESGPTSSEYPAEGKVTDRWRLGRSCISRKRGQLCFDMKKQALQEGHVTCGGFRPPKSSGVGSVRR